MDENIAPSEAVSTLLKHGLIRTETGIFII